uniref:Bactericidal permeability-increasing protein n=1 Tax=Latimeria chalumnae TaxID=7897 RepID=H3AJD3_LATCH
STVSKVLYLINKLHIDSLKMPSPDVEFSPNTDIKVRIVNARLQASGDWQVKYLFISDSGTFTAGVYGITIKLNIGVTADDTGRLMVWNSYCLGQVGSVDIQLHGGGSWFYGLFHSKLQDIALQQINQKKQLCSSVHTAFTAVNQQLKKIPGFVSIDQYIELDYLLVSLPEVTEKFLGTDFKGEFYNIKHHTEPPFEPTPFYLCCQDGYMFSLGVSQYSVNSAAYAYYTAGALQIQVTDNMIPKASPIRLNTSSFGNFIPGLSKLYPNMLMVMEVNANKQPLVTLGMGSITTETSFSLNTFAILPNTSLARVFVLELSVSVSGKVQLSGMKLTGLIVLNNISLSVAHSDIGPFDVKPIEKLVKIAAYTLGISTINARLKKGFPLPHTDKLKFINPLLKMNQGVITVATDVQINL